jgi:hypothetical protein
MRPWANDLGDEPGDNTSPEDWQLFKRRVEDVAHQVEKLMGHGWSLRGLIGWPSGLVPQARRGRHKFTGLFPGGRVTMTPERGGAMVTVDPIETDDKCPWEED